MSGVSPAYNLSVNFRLPQNPPPLPSNVPQPVVDAFEDIYLIMNNLANAFVTLAGAGPRLTREWPILANDPTTVLAGNVNRIYVRAFEVIAYGELITFGVDAGELVVKLASATDNSRPAVGFCNTTTGAAIGDVVEYIIGHGLLPASGLTPGAHYFLSTTPGFLSAVPAVAAGNIEQYIGVALAADRLYLNTSYWIQH